MIEKDLLQAVREQLKLCAGFDGDKIAADREMALRYYFQRPRGDEVAGRSSVVSGDLSAMTEAVLSQISDAFSTDDIAEFAALGADDEDQAQLESDVVSHFVMGQNNGFLQILSGVKDALLLRNGVVKVWVDEQRRSSTNTLEGVTLEALAELTAEHPNLETKVQKYDSDTGEAVIQATRIERTFRTAAVPLENFLYLADWDRIDLQECPFVAERHVEPRSELVKRGFPKEKVDALKKYTADFKIDAAARSAGSFLQNRIGVDPSQDPIEWYECYVLMDHDGDGISERRRISISDQTLLENEPVELVPYAVGTAFLNPHRLTGISLYDKLKQTQDINTGLQRILLDGLNTTVKNRVAYLDGKVNVDDLGDGRPDGAIRVKASVQDVSQAVMPFAVPDISQGVLANIELTKRNRAEMGGAALDLATAQMQIGGDRMGSQGLDRAYSVMEQLSALMTKLIACTLIRGVFLLAHETLRRNFAEPVQVKRHGRWQSAIPSQWPRRPDVTIKVGMSPGERARRVATLDAMLNAQLTLAQQGMDEVLVNIDGFYNLLMDRARAADIQNPEQYFVDPRSEQAQRALRSKQQQAQEQETMRQQLVQQAIQLEQMRSAMEKYKTDVEAQFKYYEVNLKAEIEEAKIVGKAAEKLIAPPQVPDPVAPNGP